MYMWNKDKQKELRKLIREGRDDKYIREYFGSDILDSSRYGKSSILPYSLFKEIKITPSETDYNKMKVNSKFYLDMYDYVLEFISKDVIYVVYLMYFEINNKPTYNIIFSTREQYDKYTIELNKMLQNGFISDMDRELLKDIIETNYNDIYGLMQKISYIIFDFYNENIVGSVLSIGETDIKIKINLYRNIIKDSFKNVREEEVMDGDNKYYLYTI